MRTQQVLDNQNSRAVTPPATSSGSESDEKGNTTLTLKERSCDIDNFFKPMAKDDRDASSAGKFL